MQHQDQLHKIYISVHEKHHPFECAGPARLVQTLGVCSVNAGLWCLVPHTLTKGTRFTNCTCTFTTQWKWQYICNGHWKRVPLWASVDKVARAWQGAYSAILPSLLHCLLFFFFPFLPTNLWGAWPPALSLILTTYAFSAADYGLGWWLSHLRPAA